MFFLTTYGVLNVTAGIERLLGSPSFRPKFKVHWAFSLLGAVGCVAVMFLINWIATVVAFFFVLIIFLWLERREMEAAWGDVRRGIWMAITRAGLMRLGGGEEAKTWRPNPLVLSGAPTSRWNLIDLASSLTHNRGIMTVATVLTSENITTDRKRSMEKNIREFLAKRSVQGLVRVINAPDAFEGAERLVDAYGLGDLVPNTIILGDSQNPERREDFCRMIANFHAQKRNQLIVHGQDEGYGDREQIDIWWGGLRGNGGLMMVLAYLLQSDRSWWDANVTLKMVVDSREAADDARMNIRRIVDRIRTGANAEVLVSDGRSFDEVLRESSREADLVFMGMAEPGDDFVRYYEQLQDRLRDLPTTIMVLAAEEISFGDVLLNQDAFQED